MAKIDPQQERQRLAEFYAGQFDGELKKVASQAYDLTDIAREMLRAEIAKRGLKVNFIEQAPVPPPKAPRPPEPGDPPKEETPQFSRSEVEVGSGDKDDLDDMVVIRQFRDLPAALLAKGSLVSAGIECALADDNMVRLDWFISNAIGGIRLLVHEQDAADAEQVLSQPIPENFDVDGVGEYEQPRCPKCGSLDVNYQELDPTAYMTLVVNVPIPFHRRAWRCHSCKVEWEDDGTPEARESSNANGPQD